MPHGIQRLSRPDPGYRTAPTIPPARTTGSRLSLHRRPVGRTSGVGVEPGKNFELPPARPQRRRGHRLLRSLSELPKIEHANHADVHWVRPESKSRVITID